MALASYAKRGMRTAWGPPLGGRARCHMGPWSGPYADRRHRLFAGDGRRKGQHHRAVWGGVGVRGAARRRASRVGAVSSGARRGSEFAVLRGFARYGVGELCEKGNADKARSWPLSGPARRAEGPWPGPSADRRHRLFAGDGRRKGRHHRADWGGVEVRGAARRRVSRLGAPRIGWGSEFAVLRGFRASRVSRSEAFVLRGLRASALLASALARYAKRRRRTRRGAGLLAGQLDAPTGPGRAHRQTGVTGCSPGTDAGKVNTTEPSGRTSECGRLRGGDLPVGVR